MTRPLLVKPDEATSFTPVRERFPSFPRNATLGWGRAFQLQFGNPPAILQIGQKRYTIEQFIQTRRETLYEVDVIEEDRQHRYWDLPDTAKIIGPWQWTGAAGDSTTAGANRAKYLIVNPNEVPTPSEQLTDLSAEDLNHLVAKEFHRVLDEKMPTVIFWRYDENQLLPAEIDIAEFSNDPDSCVPLKHMFQLAGETDVTAALKQASERPNGIRNLLKRVSKRGRKEGVSL